MKYVPQVHIQTSASVTVCSILPPCNVKQRVEWCHPAISGRGDELSAVGHPTTGHILRWGHHPALLVRPVELTFLCPSSATHEVTHMMVFERVTALTHLGIHVHGQSSSRGSYV